MRLTICSPCQMGDHKNHYRDVQPVAEGMMGGAQCHCKGECRDKRYMPEIEKNFMKNLRKRYS